MQIKLLTRSAITCNRKLFHRNIDIYYLISTYNEGMCYRCIEVKKSPKTKTQFYSYGL